jgi:hypothetical protein
MNVPDLATPARTLFSLAKPVVPRRLVFGATQVAHTCEVDPLTARQTVGRLTTRGRASAVCTPLGHSALCRRRTFDGFAEEAVLRKANLEDQVYLATWPTPPASSSGPPPPDVKADPAPGFEKNWPPESEAMVKFVGAARQTATGAMLIGSDAGITMEEAGVQLSPEHTRGGFGMPRSIDAIPPELRRLAEWQEWVGNLSREQRDSVLAPSGDMATPSSHHSPLHSSDQSLEF